VEAGQVNDAIKSRQLTRISVDSSKYKKLQGNTGCRNELVCRLDLHNSDGYSDKKLLLYSTGLFLPVPLLYIGAALTKPGSACGQS
jgi:hypothetical protein